MLQRASGKDARGCWGLLALAFSLVLANAGGCRAREPGDQRGVGGEAGAAQIDGAGGVALAGATGGKTDCPLVLGAALLKHACQHALQGPFLEIPAWNAAFVVDRTHTTYTIRSQQGSAVGSLSLRVAMDGRYALFLSHQALVALTNAASEALAPQHEQSVPTCNELVRVLVFELQRGEHYQLVLRTDAELLDLIVEGIVDTDWVPSCDLGPSRPEPEHPMQCSEESEECFNDCGALGAACSDGAECCSGRCYGSECVPLECRSEGQCERDEECCQFCHFTETPHCH